MSGSKIVSSTRTRLSLQACVIFISICMISVFIYVHVPKDFSPSTTMGNNDAATASSTLTEGSGMGTGIVHIVMFAFKEGVGREEIQATCDRMLSLKNDCLHPLTRKPYVKSVVGGKNNSPEGLQNGITHAFVVEFETDEDRTYYLKNDPAHLSFVKSVGDLVVKAQVVDFVPGVFG